MQERSVVMTAIHAAQRVVVYRFDAELERYECAPRDLIDHPDFFVIDAVGTSADGQPHNFRMIDRVGIELAKIFAVRVRVRERLKVDDELTRVESFPNVFDAFTDLIPDGICFYR